MKKLFLFFTILTAASISTAKAQDCMSLFPDKEGTILINKTFDAKNNLISTMTYKVEKVYDANDGQDMAINFMLTNRSGKVIDSGSIDAKCDGSSFYMKMKNRSMSPEVTSIISTDTELVGDFLDYPDVFSSADPLGSAFKMSGGEFTIQNKSGDKKVYTNVRVYNRKYVGTETVTTKAGVFHAAKITFSFDVTADKKTTSYTGTEWYAPNAGIVRSETYNGKTLVNYTVLTEIK